MRILKLFLFIIIMMLGSAFAVLNSDEVPFNYYFGTSILPLSLIMSVALGLGVLLGVLSSIGMVLRLKRKNLSLQRRSKLVNEEVNNLRSLPLKEQ